eukprot:TRINITY_DN120870_c0_g1_i1.p1 TRINITY_DN120870_c0_g1~~TRINITY_DN120870_c0_g1_i1.p1  ORF type:complete len:469 (+),score=70.39 TRINITY_DN120870_c0_g1_i1:81-1487(+)
MHRLESSTPLRPSPRDVGDLAAEKEFTRRLTEGGSSSGDTPIGLQAGIHCARISQQRATSDAGNYTVSRRRQVRVIEPTREWARIRTECTVASTVVGRGTRVEAAVFRTAVKGICSTSTLWAIWWLGLCVGLLSLGDVLPAVCIWTSVLMLPLPICTVPVLCTDLMWLVLREFETYLLLYYDGYLVYSAIKMIWSSQNVFWVCYFPSIIVAAFADCYPSKWRSMFSMQFFFGHAMVLLTWGLILICGRMKVEHYPYVVGDIEGSVSQSSLNAVATLLFFCIRHCYAAYFHPDEFVILLSPMRTAKKWIEEQIEVVDGRAYYASGRRATGPLTMVDGLTLSQVLSRQSLTTIEEAHSGPIDHEVGSDGGSSFDTERDGFSPGSPDPLAAESPQVTNGGPRELELGEAEKRPSAELDLQEVYTAHVSRLQLQSPAVLTPTQGAASPQPPGEQASSTTPEPDGDYAGQRSG